MATKKLQIEKNYTAKDIVVRLDAIIRLLLESNTEKKEEFNKTSIIPMLNSVGLEPTDIARIYGKNKATDISPYLYQKKKKGTENKP